PLDLLRVVPACEVAGRVHCPVVTEVEELDRVHLEMQMRPDRVGVAGVADEAEDVAATNMAVVPRELRVAREVRVVETVAPAVAEPEAPAADPVPADREDGPVRHREHRTAERREEVVAVMPAAGDVAAQAAVGVAPVGVAVHGEVVLAGP